MHGAAECGKQRGLVNDRHDRPRDQIPVLANTDRNHRLNIEHVNHLVVMGARAEIEIALQRHADEIGHGILGFLCELFRARLLLAWRGCGQEAEQKNSSYRNR